MTKSVSNLARRPQLTKRKTAPATSKKVLEDNACYVLITCGAPSKDGKMQVEMTYEGDPILAAYLVESAQGFLEVEE